jgi:hypothetical protein
MRDFIPTETGFQGFWAGSQRAETLPSPSRCLCIALSSAVQTRKNSVQSDNGSHVTNLSTAPLPLGFGAPLLCVQQILQHLLPASPTRDPSFPSISLECSPPGVSPGTTHTIQSAQLKRFGAIAPADQCSLQKPTTDSSFCMLPDEHPQRPRLHQPVLQPNRSFLANPCIGMSSHSHGLLAVLS